MIRLELEPLLEKRAKTFYWLAKTAGIHHAVMSKLRHNDMKSVRFDVLDRLCDVLECSPGDILVKVDEGKKGSKK